MAALVVAPLYKHLLRKQAWKDNEGDRQLIDYRHYAFGVGTGIILCAEKDETIAGYELPDFAKKYPRISDWFSGAKQPTVKQLEDFPFFV